MSFTVVKSLQFPQKTLNYAYSSDYNNDDGHFALGGILSDTKLIWQAKGPYLEIRDTKKGSKVGSWTFGSILKDSNTKIVDVKELQKSSGKLALLVVALECNISGGIICLFNIFSSKVIRAIQVKQKISSLCVVDSGVEVLNLPGPLHDFDGILAVGTEEGNVLLIDLCRQICEESLLSFTIRDELLPSQLAMPIPLDVSRIDYYREKAVRKGNHLAIYLNVVLDSESEHFILKNPKGKDELHVNREEVCTSALYYCNELTSLLVGFNFGAFQLWDLTSLKLIYTSPVCDEHIPITHFALQEPTDDPRAFCYVWVSYSNMDLYQTGLPFAVMYALCYESKEYHEGYGYLYQNFQYCAIRFQVELGSLEDNRPSTQPKGGICLSLQPVSKFHGSKDTSIHLSTGDTLALCVISWITWHDKNNTQCNALIFDLNQWYKEQMPSFSKWANCNNYILRINLRDLIAPHRQKKSPLLGVEMDETSLRQFVGVQRLEEHFYPTSLTFDMWLLKENEMFSIHSEGLQKALLQQIQVEGPLCLLRPSDIFQRIISLGLIPLFSDVPITIQVSADIQKETILNVALEHHLLNCLCKCASEWANGRFTSAGCTIDFLLKWAFQRAITLKTNCDKLCSPLFDYSQSRLDKNTSKLLNSCTGQINVLYKFYQYITNNLSQYIPYINLAEEQRDSLEMVATYFEVLQWLVNVGLLPECHPSAYPRPDNSERISAPYPVKHLIEYYNERRAHLQQLSKEKFTNSDSLLFIDNLINHKCGAEQLQRQWQEDGGSGLYPPPSLQSLLRTYLIPNASICHKHSLVIYLFLDLAMALDQSKYSPVITYLIKFPAVFKVTPSIIKITQAFWQLDHGDHNTAIEQLLDHFVLKKDLQPWHHNIAMKSLLIQNQHKAALRYMQVRRPPMTDDESILTAISLYITNNMVSEALYFMKEHCQADREKFLKHLFDECNKNKCLHVLLYKCLNDGEERAFLKYLANLENSKSKDLQVFYFLLRSRFLEAFDIHSKIRKINPDTKGLIGQTNTTLTDQVVRIFKNCLPDVNKNLVEYIRKEKNSIWKEVPRPTPLSVFVHNTEEQIKYKSSMIHAAISKAKNTFHDTANSTKINELLTEETPFLRTPTAFRNVKRHNTSIITPKVIHLDEDGDEIGPSPPKRIKLSPRTTMNPNTTLLDSPTSHSKMMTPIVKRKTSLEHRQTPEDKYRLNICTPQSILKVGNVVRRSANLSESSYNIQPRRSLSRSRQHVQFEDGFSSSFSDQSIMNKVVNDNTLDEKSLQELSRDVSAAQSSKNSTNTTDEFYSPNTSLDDKINMEEKLDDTKETDNIEENLEAKTKFDSLKEIEQSSTQSPRARRSYKRSLGEISPVRSSPRLSRSISRLPTTMSESAINVTHTQTEDAEVTSKLATISKTDNEEKKSLSDTTNETEKTLEISPDSFIRSPKSPRVLPRIKGRKSLSRKVLEHNSFLRLQGSPLVKENSVTKTEKTTIIEKSNETVKTTTIESSIGITDTETSETESPISERRRVSSSSIKKRTSSLYSPGISDVSASEFCLEQEPDQSLDELKFSDSMLDYVDYCREKIKNKTLNDTAKTNTTHETKNMSDIENEVSEPIVGAQENTTMFEPDSVENKPPNDSINSLTSSNRRTSLFSVGHDTSTESHYSFQEQEQESLDELKLSDSIVEFINSVKEKIKMKNTIDESVNNKASESSLTSLKPREKTLGVSDKSLTVSNTKTSEISFAQDPSLQESNSLSADKSLKLISAMSNSRTTIVSEGSSKQMNEGIRQFSEENIGIREKISFSEPELSEEDDFEENQRQQVYEDLSSGSEDIDEILKSRADEAHQSKSSDHQVISLDSSDQSEEKISRSPSPDENISHQTATPTPNKTDEVIEIQSSDSEPETESNKLNDSKYVGDRQEVSLYSQLEESNSNEEDFSLVYKDLDDETDAATSALQAEMNEPTYNLEHSGNDVFEEVCIETGAATAQVEVAEQSAGRLEEKNDGVLEKSNKISDQQKEQAFKESGISVSFEDTEQSLSRKDNKNRGESNSRKQKEETTKESHEEKLDEVSKEINVQQPGVNSVDVNMVGMSAKSGAKQDQPSTKSKDEKATGRESRTRSKKSQATDTVNDGEPKLEIVKENVTNNDEEKNVHKIDSSTNTTILTTNEVINEKFDAESPEEVPLMKDGSTNTTAFIENVTSEGALMKDGSTNTTGFIENVTSGEVNQKECKKDDTKEQIKSMEEESTITTVSSSTSEIKRDIEEKSATADDSFISITRPEPRKVYTSKTVKKTNEDLNKLDTTEEVSESHEIVVVAQVHTPTKKEVNESPVKRITRRRSLLLSQEEQIGRINKEDCDNTDSSGKKENEGDFQKSGSGQDERTLTGKRTRKASSSSSTGRKPTRTRSSSFSTIMKSVDIDCTPSSSKEIVNDRTSLVLLKRTRSASVDEVKTYSRKRSLRTSTEEQEKTLKNEDVLKPNTRNKANSVADLPVIAEEVKLKRKTKSGTSSSLKNYATSRRLTRRQASIIKGIPTPTDVTAEDDSEVEEKIGPDDFDPIILLDKEPFEGNPDPEEQKVYEQSSPSTSSVSSFTKQRRISRSASVTSDITPEVSETSPKKRRSITRSKTESPSKPAIRTRSRRQSDVGSAVSEKSDQISPKKSKKEIEDDNESNASASSRASRRTRASSVNSDGSTSRKQTQKKIKAELPKIPEESTSDTKTATESRKRTRK